MGEYVKPAPAFRKLDAAKILRQGVYMYGSYGFGKTELIKQYLKSQKYIYIPCLNDCTETVIIDNVNAIKNAKLRGEIAAME